MVSGLPKRLDSRLVVMTSAGDPAHWSRKVLDAAHESERWRVSEIPGPLPWADPEDLAEQRRLLPESAFDRLHLNRWTAAEDRLVSPEDLAACLTLAGPLAPEPQHRYVIGVDLGIRHDRSVLAVAHAEPFDPTDPTGPPRVLLDRMQVWTPAPDRPVNLGDVEAAAYEAATAYRASIRIDPHQAIGMAQRLRARGVHVEEWAFTDQSVGRLGMTLHLLLREHRLALPDDPDLADELLNVRLRESRPGVYRLDHDAGKHDDRAVALALAALALTEHTTGAVSITVPRGSLRASSRPDPAAPGGGEVRRNLARDRSALVRAAGRSPRGLRGGPLLRVPGAYDDPARRFNG